MIAYLVVDGSSGVERFGFLHLEVDLETSQT
jgi:hypothetical protein